VARSRRGRTTGRSTSVTTWSPGDGPPACAPTAW
jgi:hypothetical protein